MKFVVSSSELLGHLQAISRVISSKNTLPILDNFLFNLLKNDLEITASDLESTLITRMKLENTEYEPEQFPGLVYKLEEARATFLLFSNGKIVCTGTKSEKEVHLALDKLIENLKKVK